MPEKRPELRDNDNLASRTQAETKNVTLYRTLLASAPIIAAATSAAAFAPDGCEQQRAQYPANWSDTSREKPLFICTSPHSEPYRIKIGDKNDAGRTLMSLVPLSRPKLAEQTDGVLRIWLEPGASATPARRQVFRHRRAQRRLMLDPRQPQRRPRLLHGQCRSAAR
jgi:hypothetical protein